MIRTSKVNYLDPRLYLLGAALSWATLGVWVKPLPPEQFSPTFLAVVRGLGTALVLALGLKTLNLSLSLRGMMAAVTYALTSLTLMMALQETGTGAAFLLQNAAPLYVPLLAYLWNRESIGFNEVIGITFVLLGLGFILTDEGISYGTVAGAISGVFWAATVVLHRKLDSTEGSVSYIAGNLLLLPALRYSDIPFIMPTEYSTHLLGIALIGSALPALLFLKGVKGAENSTHASLFLTLEPVFAAALASLLLGEEVGWGTVVGGGVILLTNAVLVLFRNQPFLGRVRIKRTQAEPC